MYPTEIEIEHYHKGKSEEDRFDVSAKGLFVIVSKLKEIFRSSNFRVDAKYKLKEPMHGITGVLWSGSRGDFLLESEGPVPRTTGLADIAGDRPWMMEIVAIHGQEVYYSALEAKIEMMESMEKSTELGLEVLKSILGEK